MRLWVTYGALAGFFVIVILILQLSHRRDRDFTDFAVAGRSFGGWYQALAFINTYIPGTAFISGVAFVATAGVIGFYQLPAFLLGQLTLYLMARRVWTWGAAYNLRTQSDLLGLRFGSRGVRLTASVVGVLALLPFLVLGMQSLGVVFSALSFGHIGYTAAVVIGVVVMSIRQIWTANMGMRGIVISDFFQGIVAYGLGSALIIALIVWLVTHGNGFDAVDPAYYAFPGPGSGQPLAFFSLVLTLVLGSLCFPDLFVRLYTGRGVASVQKAAAIGAPIGLVFLGGLNILALLASSVPAVSSTPDQSWFLLANQAGGVLCLALAGVVVFAASMGNFDATVQSCGTQIANDVLGPYIDLSSRQMTWIARTAIGVLTVATALIACMTLPQLYTLVLLGIQTVVQLAVPLYLGIFTRFGNARGAIGGLAGGIVTLFVIDFFWPVSVPWAWGLSAGIIGLAINCAIYVASGVLFPADAQERTRLDELFQGLTAGTTE